MNRHLIAGAIVVLLGMTVLLLTSTRSSSRIVSPATAVYAVDRLSCGACAENIRTALLQLDGVDDARTDVGQGRTIVRFDAGRIDAARIAAAITAAGYPAVQIAADAPLRQSPRPASGCSGGCCDRRN